MAGEKLVREQGKSKTIKRLIAYFPICVPAWAALAHNKTTLHKREPC